MRRTIVRTCVAVALLLPVLAVGSPGSASTSEQVIAPRRGAVIEQNPVIRTAPKADAATARTTKVARTVQTARRTAAPGSKARARSVAAPVQRAAIAAPRSVQTTSVRRAVALPGAPTPPTSPVTGGVDAANHPPNTVPCVFYNLSEPVDDLGIFDRELPSGDEVDNWTHTFTPPAGTLQSVVIDIPEIFSDNLRSRITIDGVSYVFVVNGASLCGPPIHQTFTFIGAAAAFAADGVVNMTFTENVDDIALDYSLMTITSSGVGGAGANAVVIDLVGDMDNFGYGGQLKETQLDVHPVIGSTTRTVSLPKLSATLSEIVPEVDAGALVPISDVTVSFFLPNGTPICSALTNALGLAACTPTISQLFSLIRAGSYMGRFLGDNEFAAAEGSAPFARLPT
ncbi:MAG: hypothetical protein ACRDJM_02720 [Actinomycetota bacterium]